MATISRRRHNLLTNALGATLTTGSTSITFASALQEGGSNISTIGTDEYLPLTIENEIVYLTAYTAGATGGTIQRGKENTVDPGVSHPNGTVIRNAPTTHDFPQALGGIIIGSGTGASVELATGADNTVLTANSLATFGARWQALPGGASTQQRIRTGGNLTLSSGTFVAVSNLASPLWDSGADNITLPASTGDVIETGLSALGGNQATAGYLDVYAVVSGTFKQAFSNGSTSAGATAGILAWYLELSINQSASGSIFMVADASAISGGNIVLQLSYASGGAKTLFGGANFPLIWWARNWGH